MRTIEPFLLAQKRTQTKAKKPNSLATSSHAFQLPPIDIKPPGFHCTPHQTWHRRYTEQIAIFPDKLLSHSGLFRQGGIGPHMSRFAVHGNGNFRCQPCVHM